MALRPQYNPPRRAKFKIGDVEVGVLCVTPSAVATQRVATVAASLQTEADFGGLLRMQADYLAEHVVDFSEIDDGSPRDVSGYLAWPAQVLAACFNACMTVDSPTPPKAADTEPSPGS